jgi:hypothetical protein
MPTEFSWLTYTKLSKEHGMNHAFMYVYVLFTTGLTGDVISLHVFGKVIVVLNSIKAAKDLLEKRGDIYSDRQPDTLHDMYALEIPIFGSN